jgi:hypothetical protein
MDELCRCWGVQLWWWSCWRWNSLRPHAVEAIGSVGVGIVGVGSIHVGVGVLVLVTGRRNLGLEQLGPDGIPLALHG